MKIVLIEQVIREEILSRMEDAYGLIQNVYNEMGSGFSRLDEVDLRALASKAQEASDLLRAAAVMAGKGGSA